MSMARRCLAILGFLAAGVVLPASAAACPALLDHTIPALVDGKPVSLCQYAGKVILVVNTASYCGFTSQYDGLEKLYERLKDKVWSCSASRPTTSASRSRAVRRRLRTFAASPMACNSR